MKLYEERGQGTLEYILLLVIALALVLGIMARFNTSFADYAENYFGQYLDCLIELGELPSLGSSAGSAGLCNANFEAFSLANGRPPTERTPTGASSGSRQNSRTNNSNNTSASSSSERDERPQSSVATSGRGTNSSGRFAVNSKGQNGKFRSSAQANGAGGPQTDGAGGVGKIQSIEDGGQQLIPIPRNSGSGYGYASQQDDDEKQANKVGIKKGKESAQNTERFERKLAVASTDDELDDEGFSIGFLLRFLLIAAILIALVIFIGGQILQFSKEME